MTFKKQLLGTGLGLLAFLLPCDLKAATRAGAIFDGAGSGRSKKTGNPVFLAKTLNEARRGLYLLAGGNINSDDVRLARITTDQRIVFFRWRTFGNWVRAEKASGHQFFGSKIWIKPRRRGTSSPSFLSGVPKTEK
ncbi:MAG: hypothetical protein HY401_07410 [Elusimicrobia bacterium]|nr:hypothetical protein [Elusimicrobiota bacterium]